ncbi:MULTISPECIES: hypothetical protein [unclassified Pseudomonas]|jgi:hypothetical protein|uniref:hypothetical protein n=1 Tax=unclassified Pseudomonas TaxID=196821 RepID=UPI002A368C75|nr:MULTISPECIES: hypothetical protein [unclassified Pseudomonas]MDX9671837.1 hypothetical protein [Pseudomonas sp. P8_250]WPN34196.1 hypothetical protein QMK53_18550 [Pseudomonas sp. P8_139]WPN44005.1 hypothetical protein QMK55_12825 [Pseudomonas sp. P8_229]
MKLQAIICMLSWTGPLAFLASLTACAAQRVYRNDVYLLNTCAAPLELTVANDSNYDDRPRSFMLSPNQRNSIANYQSFGEGVLGQISDQYSLTLKSPAATKTIDAQTLRKALASIEKTEERGVRSWTVNNGAFCP